MVNKGSLTKGLALAGTILVWLPILFTIITSIFGTIRSHMFRVDYLIPAELFPVVLVGTLLLFWAAQRARTLRKPIIWGLISMLVFLIGGQALAVVSGLASGAIEPTGWPWALVVASISLYSLSLIVVCVTGVSLVKKLFLIR